MTAARSFARIALASCSLAALPLLGPACGRTDVAFAPAAAVVERELQLDDGDTVLVEVHAGDDADLRAAFMAVHDGISLAALVDTLAMGEPAQLLLDATDEPVLVVEVAGTPRAYIWR
ncbi:MAG: hypothetical protein U0168_03770 [Nannocystaceae bacterium]